MTHPMMETKDLTKDEKGAVGILSIGTFLEYFDLMLYVHMAVLLNEIFFPKTDPKTAAILGAFTFCSTYVFRPFGALLFGWIGDKIGRKPSIVIATILMGVCCVVMALTPTYDRIGITATYIMITCRIVQGMSSMGEVVGALLYLTEFVRKPARYFAVSLVPVFCDLGSSAAIFCAMVCTTYLGNWRFAFIIGAFISAISIIARANLRETPIFITASLQRAQEKQTGTLSRVHKNNDTHTASFFKSSVCLFLMECTWPLCFYFVYVFCGDILKSSFAYSASDVIHHNLIVTLYMLLFCMFKSFLCRFFHPLIIFEYRLILSSILYIATPFWLEHLSNATELMVLQVLVVILSADIKFASSSVYPHFPVLQRFKSAAFLYALSRALTYIATSFGMVYLVDTLGHWGIFLSMAVVTIGTTYGFLHFRKLEKATGDLDNYAFIR